MFNVGDTIRRVDRPYNWVPLGYVTEVVSYGDGIGYHGDDGLIMCIEANTFDDWELVKRGPAVDRAKLLEISTKLLVALASNPSAAGTPEQIASRAVEAARALLAECSKP